MKIFAHIFLHFKLILNQNQQTLLIQHKYNVFPGYITIPMYNYRFLELSVKRKSRFHYFRYYIFKMRVLWILLQFKKFLIFHKVSIPNKAKSLTTLNKIKLPHFWNKNLTYLTNS